jgi:hypothetical protein
LTTRAASRRLLFSLTFYPSQQRLALLRRAVENFEQEPVASWAVIPAAMRSDSLERVYAAIIRIKVDSDNRGALKTLIGVAQDRAEEELARGWAVEGIGLVAGRSSHARAVLVRLMMQEKNEYVWYASVKPLIASSGTCGSIRKALLSAAATIPDRKRRAMLVRILEASTDWWGEIGVTKTRNSELGGQ